MPAYFHPAAMPPECGRSHAEFPLPRFVRAVHSHSRQNSDAEPVAGFHQPPNNPRHAQVALKTAKSSCRVEFYKPSALAATRRGFIIETELRRALDRDGLTMAYQPLMSLKTGRVIGFEALARWKHPVMGVISLLAVPAVAGLAATAPFVMSPGIPVTPA